MEKQGILRLNLSKKSCFLLGYGREGRKHILLVGVLAVYGLARVAANGNYGLFCGIRLNLSVLYGFTELGLTISL